MISLTTRCVLNRPPKNQKNQKFSKSKSVLPKMSARFFYAGKKRPRPIWGPPGQFFAWAGKIQKLHKFCLFSLVGPWALFTRFGALAAIHPRWGNRYHGDCSILWLHATLVSASDEPLGPIFRNTIIRLFKMGSY